MAPMQTVVDQKLSHRRVVVAAAVALSVLLAVAVKFQWTFPYLIARLAILFFAGFFLSRLGSSRTRTLISVVALSILEQAFLKTVVLYSIGPPGGGSVNLLALFTQMSIGAIAFLPVILLVGLGGYELARRRS